MTKHGYASPRINEKEIFVSTPDHAENTGDNLRHAAEVQEQARNEETGTQVPPEEGSPAKPLPDFNT